MNYGRILIYKNLNQKKNTNGRKKRKRNDLNSQDIKLDLVHSQKKNQILKNILTEANKSGQKDTKA